MNDEALDWPIETAAVPDADAATLMVPGSNLLLDLHGDPTRARLTVFSDGNHHMALEETLAGFLRENPDCLDVFYATTPPRIIVDALHHGSLRSGNLVLTLTPQVFISPEDILARLFVDGLIGQPAPFMQSDGLAVLVRRGNPARITGPGDLLGDRVRLALSNPITESASYTVYERLLLDVARQHGADLATTRDHLRSDAVLKSRIIHHREIPSLLAADRADASVVYRHLAVRYARIFPTLFEHLVVDLTVFDDPEAYRSHYHVAPVGEPDGHAGALLAFLQSDVAKDIYRSHALQPG